MPLEKKKVHCKRSENEDRSTPYYKISHSHVGNGYVQCLPNIKDVIWCYHCGACNESKRQVASSMQRD